jgi:hypothetical protein
MNRHIIPIDSPDDPRIADYRLLKKRELAESGGKFIFAEIRYNLNGIIEID